MMSFKFQFFWTEKITDKQSAVDKQRDEKTYEAEKQRKKAAELKDSLTSKNLTENFDEKNYLKLMKGPFYNLMSRNGSSEDDFVNCATYDLIDSANAELLKILLLGKPRSGKTTLAKALAKKLDLVRISPEIWLETLFAKVKKVEDDPPDPTESEQEEDRLAEEAAAKEAEEAEKRAEEEAAAKAAAEEAAAANGGEEPKEEDPKAEEEKKAEGEEGAEGEEAKEPELDENGNPIEKPEGEEEKQEEEEPVVEKPKRPRLFKWMTEFEYDILLAFREGKALDLEQVDEILRIMVNSPEAQTKGFIVDLTF